MISRSRHSILGIDEKDEKTKAKYDYTISTSYQRRQNNDIFRKFPLVIAYTHYVCFHKKADLGAYFWEKCLKDFRFFMWAQYHEICKEQSEKIKQHEKHTSMKAGLIST